MPISSSRRRLTLTSPFVGASPSNHSASTTKVANTFKAIDMGMRSTARSAATRPLHHQATTKYRVATSRPNQGAKSHVGLPILARVQPRQSSQLRINLSDSVTKPRNRARLGVQQNHHHHQKGEGTSQPFGLGMPRDKFSFKKIRFFSSPPKPNPLILCFPYPGYDLTHKEVLAGIKRRGVVDINRVRNIQFVDMNVLIGTAGVFNRWLIALKDHESRNRLFNDGIYIRGERLCLRRYDDVNYEDYRDYLRRENTLQSDAHTAIQKLLSL